MAKCGYRDVKEFQKVGPGPRPLTGSTRGCRPGRRPIRPAGRGVRGLRLRVRGSDVPSRHEGRGSRTRRRDDRPRWLHPRARGDGFPARLQARCPGCRRSVLPDVRQRRLRRRRIRPEARGTTRWRASCSGTATITATATQDLSRFDLDLAHLTASSVTVDGRPATADRLANELVVTPAAGIVNRHAVHGRRRVRRESRKQLRNPTLGEGGWLGTKDGGFALGQPESASTWFPVNDHPSDKATFRLAMTVPDGTEVISNGVPGPRATAGGWTTWTWTESSPMASYLATVLIGQYRIATQHPRRQADDHRGARLGAGRRRRPPGRWRARARSRTSWRPSSGPIRSTRTAGSWSTTPDRLRAGDPDPAGVRRHVLRAAARTRAWSRTSSPTSGSATAWHSSGGRTSGSTRASPRTRSGCGRSTWAGSTVAQNFDRVYAGFDWREATGQPRCRPAVRRRGLPARRDDRVRAAPDDRRRGVRPAAHHLDQPSTGTATPPPPI